MLKIVHAALATVLACIGANVLVQSGTETKGPISDAAEKRMQELEGRVEALTEIVLSARA